MISLALENPLNSPDSLKTKTIHQIDKIITIIFTQEAIFRIIALGFFSSSIQNRQGYIRSGSN